MLCVLPITRFRYKSSRCIEQWMVSCISQVFQALIVGLNHLVFVSFSWLLHGRKFSYRVPYKLLRMDYPISNGNSVLPFSLLLSNYVVFNAGRIHDVADEENELGFAWMEIQKKSWFWFFPSFHTTVLGRWSASSRIQQEGYSSAEWVDCHSFGLRRICA